MIALNKNQEGCPPDIRPIAMGETIRRLAGKCMCALVKDKAAEFFQPQQLGVACHAGAEKVAHQLGGCIEEHWMDEDFVVLNSLNAKCIYTYMRELSASPFIQCCLLC